MAIALVVALKIASLLVLYAGWKLYPRADYRDAQGQRVDLWMTRPNTAFIDNLANFDGAWFVRIAALGYRRLADQNYDLAAETRQLRVMDQLGFEQGRWPPEPGTDRFDRGYGYRHFPLWPWLIRAGTRLGADAVHAEIVLANLLAMIYGVLLFILARRNLPVGAAALAVALSQLHPGGYTFSGGYNEPLFLALATGSMTAARAGRWRIAGPLAMIAAMTRIFGIVLIAPLAYEWLEQRTEERTGLSGLGNTLAPAGLGRGLAGLRSSPGVGWLLLVPAGLIAVAITFALASGDALIWTRVHEANRYGHLNWPWLMMMETWRKGWVIAAKELPLHALLLGVLILSWGRVRGPYWVWMLLFFIHHTTNGNHSYLRYQVECMPLFIAIATLTYPRRWLWPIVLLVSAGLFVFFGVRFINGYWVA
jgi:hypothetical protein